VIGQRGEWIKRGRPIIEVVRVISHKLVLARLPNGTEAVVNCRNIRWIDHSTVAPAGSAASASLDSVAVESSSSDSAASVRPTAGAQSDDADINSATVVASAPAAADPIECESAPFSVACAGDGKLEVRMQMHESDLECVVCM
jgi:hypothetical protein